MKATATALAMTGAATLGTAVASSGLAEYDLSWLIIAAAAVGAATAIPGFLGKGRPAIVSGVAFGFGLGALGGPVAADWLSVKWSITHALAPALLAFLLAHFAYNDLHRIVDWFIGHLVKGRPK